jgi:hypothetical protein
MDYIPVTTEVENQLYRNAAILAHNLTRELQMKVAPRQRRTTPKRAALWRFSELETPRRTVIQRAGRKMRPAGKLILSLDSNERLETELTHDIETLQNCAA